MDAPPVLLTGLRTMLDARKTAPPVAPAVKRTAESATTKPTPPPAAKRSTPALKPAATKPPTAKPSTPTPKPAVRSEEHTSELQSLMRISYAVFCLKTKNDYALEYSHNYFGFTGQQKNEQDIQWITDTQSHTVRQQTARLR